MLQPFSNFCRVLNKGTVQGSPQVLQIQRVQIFREKLFLMNTSHIMYNSILIQIRLQIWKDIKASMWTLDKKSFGSIYLSQAAPHPSNLGCAAKVTNIYCKKGSIFSYFRNCLYQKATFLTEFVWGLVNCGWDLFQIYLLQCGWDLVEWLERLAVYAKVAAVLGLIPASSDTVESEERQM